MAIDDDAPEIEESRQALTGSAQSNAEIFSWSSNDEDTLLRPVSSHVCFLSRVSGNLGGNSEIKLHRSTGNVQDVYRAQGLAGGWGDNVASDTWKLGGAQGEKNSLSAESICVPLSDFYSDPGFEAVFSAPAWANVETSRPNCDGERSGTMWNGDAAAFLTGIQGNFEGSGEVSEVIDGPIDGPSQVHIHTGKCNYWFEVDGVSLFVGLPGQTSMWRYNYEVSAGSDKSRTTQMMSTSEGVCYLQRVSGDFDGAEERVRIYPEVDANGVERWMLEAKAGGGSASAKAQCVSYNQRSGCAAPDVPCL